MYKFRAGEIGDRIAATADDVIEQTRRNLHEFVWNLIESPDELHRRRLQAMNVFLDDFTGQEHRGRYIAGELPSLPFRDGAFNLAVCSHFLFLYSEQLGGSFHRAGVAELCRVAHEVRIFPLLSLGAVRSPLVDSVMAGLNRSRYRASIEPVPYEFQRGGNEMLRISRVATSSS